MEKAEQRKVLQLLLRARSREVAAARADDRRDEQGGLIAATALSQYSCRQDEAYASVSFAVDQ